MPAEEFSKRLDEYKKFSGVRTNKEIADLWQRSPGRLSDCINHEGLSNLSIVRDFAEAIDVQIEIFIGDFDRYSQHLEDKFTARWRDIESSDAYRKGLANAITHEGVSSRLVQPVSNNGDRNYPTIQIGSSNRLIIDLLALLRDQGIINAETGEGEGFEPSDGTAPLQDFFVYVLQVERTGCVLLRPNSHFSLSDEPRDNEDIRWISDDENPGYGMYGMLYIPSGTAKQPQYMVFGGEPGLTRIIVLIARWPAIHKTLRDALSHQSGADPRMLDELAANLKTSEHQTDPSAKDYWRIYEQTYELVR